MCIKEKKVKTGWHSKTNPKKVPQSCQNILLLSIIWVSPTTPHLLKLFKYSFKKIRKDPSTPCIMWRIINPLIKKTAQRSGYFTLYSSSRQESCMQLYMQKYSVNHHCRHHSSVSFRLRHLEHCWAILRNPNHNYEFRGEEQRNGPPWCTVWNV